MPKAHSTNAYIEIDPFKSVDSPSSVSLKQGVVKARFRLEDRLVMCLYFLSTVVLLIRKSKGTVFVLESPPLLSQIALYSSKSWSKSS